MKPALIIIALGGLLGCTSPTTTEPSPLDGDWSGVCMSAAGGSLSVAVTDLVEYMPMLEDVTGDLASYRGAGLLDDAQMTDVRAWHCIDERGCMIGSDPYVQDDVLVQIDAGGTRLDPFNGFLYLHRDPDPDSMSGECLVVLAGGATDILSGAIVLTR